MKILYVAIRYDYGQADRGFSFEHANFYDSLVHMGHEVIYFDYQTLLNELGRDAMNRRLQQAAAEHRPDLMFVCLTGDQLDFATLKAISAGLVNTRRTTSLVNRMSE